MGRMMGVGLSHRSLPAFLLHHSQTFFLPI